MTSTLPEATALTEYTTGNTVARKFSTGRMRERAMRARRLRHTKSTIEETQLERIAREFSLSTSLSPASLLMRLELNSWKSLPTDSNATLATVSARSSMLAATRAHQAETRSRRLTLFSQSVTRSSRARTQPRVSVTEKRRLSLGESKHSEISLLQSEMSLARR